MPCELAAAIVELLVPKQENQRVPILELRVPSSRNCQFPNVGTSMSHSWNHGSRVLDLAVPKRWNQCYPTLVSVPGTSRSQTLEPMLPGLGTTVWSDVYTSFFCTCTRCCMKKAAKVLFNWPASKNGTCGKKELHIGQTWNTCSLKFLRCFAHWSGTTDAFGIGILVVTDSKKKARD